MNELICNRNNGTAVIDGKFVGYFIENRNKLILPGTYKVVLTPSGRAASGALWTCWEDNLLPELQNVPGRVAIRIHAANTEAELNGCIALGVDRSEDCLLHSRAALQLLKDRVKFPFWLNLTARKI